MFRRWFWYTSPGKAGKYLVKSVGNPDLPVMLREVDADGYIVFEPDGEVIKYQLKVHHCSWVGSYLRFKGPFK